MTECLDNYSEAELKDVICAETGQSLEDLAEQPRLKSLIEEYRESGEVRNPGLLMEAIYLGQHRRRLKSDGSRAEQETSAQEAASNRDLMLFSVTGEIPALNELDGLRAQIGEDVLGLEIIKILDELTAGFDEDLNPKRLREKVETYFQRANSIKYNRDAHSGFDPTNSQRLNCNSGTFLYLYLAVQSLSPKELSRVVLIYTNGHVLPGFKIGDGRYESLEMTAEVQRPTIFSKENHEVGAFKVVKPFAGLLEGAAGEKIHADTVLIDESHRYFPEDEVLELNMTDLDQRQPGIINHIHSFGQAQVPGGDIERGTVDFIDYRGNTYLVNNIQDATNRFGEEPIRRESSTQ